MGENSDVPSFLRFSEPHQLQRGAQMGAGLGPNRSGPEWPAFPLNPAMSDLNLPAGVMGELEERMVALQELYEKQRQNLFLHFQQSQTQLAVQHLRCAQQLLQEYSVRNHLQSQRHQHQMVSAAAKQLQDMYYSSQEGQSGTESSAGAHRRPANGLQRSDSPREMGSSDERISASTSGSTTTISEGTKDKLRAMIQSKKNRQKLQSVGNSPYEVLHGTPADDYSLRKASSEPNLKMRTVAALRAKLAPHRTSPKSPHQATPYAKPFAMAQKSSSVAEMGVRRMDLQAEMIESIRPFNAAPSENQMDTGEPSDDVWHRPAIVGSDRRGQFLAAAPPPNFLAAALVAANRAAPGGGGLLHQQLLRPQPLYTSPSLPEINSNAALRHLALQSSLQAAEIYTNEIPPAVWQEIFGPSAAYLSALRSSAGLPFGTAAAPLRSQNQSNPVGPIPTQLSSSLNNEVVTDSHGYDSLMGRNVLFAATTASSHREAMKLLDSHSSSLPSTSHMGVVTSSSDFIAGSGGMASNNALKEQLRDIILRRKSLVKEETEDEVDMEAPRNGVPTALHNRVSQYPSNLRTVSNPLPTVMERSGKQLTNILFRERLEEKVNKEKSENGGGNRVSFIDVRSNREGLPDDGVLRTGLAYDTLMCKHHCLCNDNKRHLEHSGRIHSIWARLQETGLAGRCERIAARKAPMEHLKLVHTDSYANFFGTTAASRAKIDVSELPVDSFTRLPCGGIGVDADTYFNDSSTSVSARMAVGCTTELTCAVAEGRLRNGFAIVRPPGHHAEAHLAQGFCYFNNVAIAVKLLQTRTEASCHPTRRIAIVDWDVHHGNGTQSAFISDPNVLYLSLHRYDNGQFFPGTGAISETGTGAAEGFNINIAWDGGPSMGDPEYLAAWRCVVEPVLKEFQPDMIVISAGFDATSGHPSALGGYTVTPAMFGYMTKQLGRLCNDRLVLVLEGGYDLASVCDCAEESVKVLCGEAPTPFSDKSLKARPNPAAVSTLKSVVDVQKKFWPGLRDDSLESSQWEWEGIAARKKFASLSVASNSCDTADLNGDLTSETTAVAKEEKEKLTAGTVNGATEAPKECRVGVIKSTKQLVEEQSHSDSMAILTPNNTAVTAGGLEVMDQT